MATPATAKTGQRHDLAARRFPLVPRPKPRRRPLTQRTDRVAQLADQASQTAGQPLTRAAEACTLAALIASDCDTLGLARDLRWQPPPLHIRDGNANALREQHVPIVALAR
ncbi:MAG: hypothetical protein ACRDN0_15065 [Trebonia sp.]